MWGAPWNRQDFLRAPTPAVRTVRAGRRCLASRETPRSRVSQFFDAVSGGRGILKITALKSTSRPPSCPGCAPVAVKFDLRVNTSVRGTPRGDLIRPPPFNHPFSPLMEGRFEPLAQCRSSPWEVFPGPFPGETHLYTDRDVPGGGGLSRGLRKLEGRGGS